MAWIPEKRSIEWMSIQEIVDRDTKQFIDWNNSVIEKVKDTVSDSLNNSEFDTEFYEHLCNEEQPTIEELWAAAKEALSGDHDQF